MSTYITLNDDAWAYARVVKVHLTAGQSVHSGTAIVTVERDDGTSGELRAEFDGTLEQVPAEGERFTGLFCRIAASAPQRSRQLGSPPKATYPVQILSAPTQGAEVTKDQPLFDLMDATGGRMRLRAPAAGVVQNVAFEQGAILDGPAKLVTLTEGGPEIAPAVIIHPVPHPGKTPAPKPQSEPAQKHGFRPSRPAAQPAEGPQPYIPPPPPPKKSALAGGLKIVGVLAVLALLVSGASAARTGELKQFPGWIKSQVAALIGSTPDQDDTPPAQEPWEWVNDTQTAPTPAPDDRQLEADRANLLVRLQGRWKMVDGLYFDSVTDYEKLTVKGNRMTVESSFDSTYTLLLTPMIQCDGVAGLAAIEKLESTGEEECAFYTDVTYDSFTWTSTATDDVRYYERMK